MQMVGTCHVPTSWKLVRLICESRSVVYRWTCATAGPGVLATVTDTALTAYKEEYFRYTIFKLCVCDVFCLLVLPMH